MSEHEPAGQAISEQDSAWWKGMGGQEEARAWAARWKCPECGMRARIADGRVRADHAPGCGWAKEIRDALMWGAAVREAAA